MNARAQLPDLSHLWMPFTANKQFKAQPRLLAGAKGMYYTSADGRQILDGTAGLWCVNAGHCREEIVSAIAKQAGEMDYAPGFQLGHPLAFEAATAVAGLMPAGLDRVFFTNSGSESVDTRSRSPWPTTAPVARPAHPPDRPRARLSRSGLRRHLGGRHLAQPQDLLRRPAAGGGPSAAHPQPGKNAYSRASRPGARTWPKNSNASSRCMTRPPSPP